jgi:2-hydroxychromene-2-carboxylate isomerase
VQPPGGRFTYEKAGISLGGNSGSSDRAVFYYDLGSPYSYLAAERIHAVFDEPPVWRPILLGGLFRIKGRESWANGPEREAEMREVERRAAAYGLPPVKWPDPWPGNMLFAMRAATFATQIGKAVSFAQAAFRQAFAAGRDLGDRDSVLIAAAACELHPNALVKAVETQGVKDALRAATDEAASRGVFGAPTVVVADQVYWGDDKLEEAAAAAS